MDCKGLELEREVKQAFTVSCLASSEFKGEGRILSYLLGVFYIYNELHTEKGKWSTPQQCHVPLKAIFRMRGRCEVLPIAFHWIWFSTIRMSFRNGESLTQAILSFICILE